ncbi:MAG: hypothetical protein IJ882_02280 [Paludibacteraceae bacterium]|nr:hypothetical protein [Paludibacteraceae bacterium]
MIKTKHSWFGDPGLPFDSVPAFEGDDRHKAMMDFYKQLTSFDGMNEMQARYYSSLAARVRPVRVVSALEVWTPEEVNLLKLAVRPAKKECYRVAALLSKVTSGRARYVEGQFWARCFGVDHAFNYIPNRGVFVDFTAEFALGYNPSQEAYVAFRDFSDEQVWEIISKNGYYGNIYNEVYLLENRGWQEKSRKTAQGNV